MTTRHVFIGWDAREMIPAAVLAHSILQNASCPVEVHFLKHKELRDAGLFWRDWRIDETGQLWDIADGAPCSTEFSFTRFLVPALARKKGLTGHVLFLDCDMLMLGDVNEVFKLAEADPSQAVWCVKHDHQPEEERKMDNIIQTRYHRKNWSSFIIFNLDHPDNSRLTVEAVNSQRGLALHGLYWTDAIGALPVEWNWLYDAETAPKFKMNTPIRNMHFTSFNPWQHPELNDRAGWWGIWCVHREFLFYHYTKGELSLKELGLVL